MSDRTVVILSMLFALLAGCQSASDSSSAADEGVADAGGGVTLSGTLAVPADVDDTEKVRAKVYVMGQESSAVETDENGHFTLPVNTTLSSTIRQAAKRLGKSASGTPAIYGLIAQSASRQHGRKVEVEIGEGDVQVDPITITKVGSIDGRFVLQNQTDHTGIVVYIPGTSFSAYTDANGNFSITDVPEGLYPLIRADFDGYHPAVVSEVKVEADTPTGTPDQELLLSTGAEGSIILNGGESVSTSRTVTLTVAVTEDAVLMRVAENDTFVGAEWTPVVSTKAYTFDSDGDKTLYVSFADANGLVSAVSSASITVDTNPTVALVSPGENSASTQPVFDWTDTALGAASYRFQLSDNSDFSTVLEEASDLAESTYTPTTILDNLVTYYWRVATVDSEGTQWGWSDASFSVDLGSVGLTAPAHNTVSNDTSPTFSWGASANAATYQFLLSSQPDLSMVTDSAQVSGTEYTPAALPATASTTYYWAVTPIDANGVSGTSSPIRSFTLDTVGPTVQLALNSGDAETSSEQVTATITASDPNGVDTMLVSQDGTFTDGQWESLATTKGLAYPEYANANTGTITAWVKVRDAAGNSSAIATDSIALMRTLKSGTIGASETWTLSGSPYVIAGTVGIPAGITLTIDPGVTVRYAGAYMILIKGTLIANGTAASRITFASQSPGISSGATQLQFEETNLANSQLSYVDFSDAAQAIKVGAETEFDQAPVKNSGTLTVSNATFTGLEIRTASYQATSRLSLDGVTLTSATVVGEYPRSEPIDINNATINASTIISDSYNYGITITNSISTDSQYRMGCCGANITVAHSTLSGGRFSDYSGSPIAGPLAISYGDLTNVAVNLPAAAVNISDSTLTYDATYTESYGIKLGNGLFEYSTLSGNTNITGIEVTGYNGYTNNGGFTLSYSDVDQCANGLRFAGGTGVFSLSASNLRGSGNYTIENHRSGAVSATSVFWDTTNTAIIPAYIYDGLDDINYGQVDWSSYLTAAQPGTGPR